MQTWYKSVVETMGSSLSSLSECHPPLPAVIQADPEPATCLDIVTAKLGFFGYTSDYGIWNRERPSNTNEQGRRLWLWMHQRSQEHVGRKFTVLSLENFRRGNNPHGPGQILYAGLFQPPSSSFIPYVYYSKTPAATSSYHPTDNDLVREHITSTHKYQWKMYNIVEIVDGNCGRYQQFYSSAPQVSPSLVTTKQMEPTAETLDSANLVLEVFASGECEATKIRRENFRRITSDEKRKLNQQQGTLYFRRNARGEEFVVTESEHDNFKKEVQQIDFRLCKSGIILAEWKVTKQNENEIDSPYFHFHANSGFFVRTTNHIRIKPLINIDSAAAILISHLCVDYFSTNPVEEKIPNPPPHITISDPSIGLKPWVPHYDRQPTVPSHYSASHPSFVNSSIPPPLPPKPTPTMTSQTPVAPPTPFAPSAPTAPPAPISPPNMDPTAPPLMNIHVTGTVEEEVPIATLLECVDADIPVAVASIVIPTARPL